MKNFTLFKRQMMFVVFMLLGCMSIHAADDGLITEQITIKLDKAGTLPDKIADNDKYKITNLKIIGEINGTDLKLLREMAGCDNTGQPTKGRLGILNLEKAKIREGGNAYYEFPNSSCYSDNDVIGMYTFYGCHALMKITLPLTVYEISGRAFSGCSSLIDITFPSTLISIEDDAFFDCCSLTDVTLPVTITYIGSEAFGKCSSLTNITLPPNLNSIKKYTFTMCSSLTKITIPSTITYIGEYAFCDCSSLIDITLPSTLTYIGDWAFSGCSSLKKIIIPSSVKTLGGRAFADCCGLTDLQIFSSEASGYQSSHRGDVFIGCNGLTSIYVSWTNIYRIMEFMDDFKDVDKQRCVLYVPKGTLQYYREGWWSFKNIVEYEPTGIDKVITSTDAKELSRYSVNGQQLSAPTKGLNIVKYSDGSVKKVAVQ